MKLEFIRCSIKWCLTHHYALGYRRLLSFKKSIHVRENGFEHDIANARGHNHLLNNFRLISAEENSLCEMQTFSSILFLSVSFPFCVYVEMFMSSASLKDIL